MICQNWYMDFSQLLLGFVKFDAGICQNWYSYFSKLLFWICQSFYMDLLKVFHGYDKAVICISQPLPNKTTLKFDQDFKDCWNFCYETKLLIESKHWMPWVPRALVMFFSNFFVLWPSALSVIALHRGTAPPNQQQCC